MIVTSIAHAYAYVIIDELISAGITTFCIAPGSRSTPLVQAIAKRNDCEVVTHYDERSIGFFALGVAKVGKKATVVITTSGTAVANLLPSCVEAFYSQIPVLFLTADRPEELHYCGANQSIYQKNLLKDMVYWTEHLDVKKEQINLRDSWKSIHRCIQYLKKGPVHLNCPFREPFFEQTFDITVELQQLAQLNKEGILQKDTSESIFWDTDHFNGKKCLCIIASTVQQLNARAIEAWSKRCHIAIFAECHASIIHSSFILRGEAQFYQFLTSQQPDYIIAIGSKWISKQVLAVLKKSDSYIIHDYFEKQDWQQCAKKEIQVNTDIAAILPNITADQHFYKQCYKHLKHDTIDSKIFNEDYCVKHVLQHISPFKHVFVGNSLAIRLVNNYADTINKNIIIHTQRGASGIDGLISTACGIAFHIKEPLMVILGDLSFLHDNNGLAFLSHLNCDITVIILNNNGGKMFNRLPVAKQDFCEKYFVMPHHFSFSGIAETFKQMYFSVVNKEQLKSVLKNTDVLKKIIEVSIESEN